MKSVVFILIAVFSLQAHAVFSAFAHVIPETQEEYIKSLHVEKMKDGDFLVKVPEFGWSKHVWLISCSSELRNDQKDFRSYIWGKDKGDRSIEVLAKLGVGPVQPFEKKDESPINNFIEIVLSEEVMSKSYIYIDFPDMVLDGGYFYTIDLPEYLRKINGGKS